MVRKDLAAREAAWDPSDYTPYLAETRLGPIDGEVKALARAAGVPNREGFGICQGRKPVQDITRWQHCWAEFYLPGYGWVPVDPADVRKAMLRENLEVSNDRTDAYRDHFWGGVDEYRVKLGEGRDLTLNPEQSGAPVNYLPVCPNL